MLQGHKNWCSQEESNLCLRLTKALHCHCTMGACEPPLRLWRPYLGCNRKRSGIYPEEPKIGRNDRIFTYTTPLIWGVLCRLSYIPENSGERWAFNHIPTVTGTISRISPDPSRTEGISHNRMQSSILAAITLSVFHSPSS